MSRETLLKIIGALLLVILGAIGYELRELRTEQVKQGKQISATAGALEVTIIEGD